MIYTADLEMMIDLILYGDIDEVPLSSVVDEPKAKELEKIALDPATETYIRCAIAALIKTRFGPSGRSV